MHIYNASSNPSDAFSFPNCLVLVVPPPPCTYPKNEQNALRHEFRDMHISIVKCKILVNYSSHGSSVTPVKRGVIY